MTDDDADELCPYPACRHMFVPVLERARPGDPTLITRVPMHNLDSPFETGGCPASLMALPLTAEAMERLGELYERYRARNYRDRPPADQPPLRPSGVPRLGSPRQDPPARNPYFTPNPGVPGQSPGGINVDRSGHLTPDDLDPRLIPGTPGRPLTGRSDPLSYDSYMGGAEEVNAAAIEALRAAAVQLISAKEKVGEAIGLLARSHAGSGQTAAQEALGIAGAASDQVDEVTRTVLHAIEQAQQVIF